MATPAPTDANRSRRLDGWDAIAGHLGVVEKTARSWSAEKGLPIHRNRDSLKSRVWAFADELNAWQLSRSSPEPNGESPHPGAPFLADSLNGAGLTVHRLRPEEEAPTRLQPGPDAGSAESYAPQTPEPISDAKLSLPTTDDPPPETTMVRAAIAFSSKPLFRIAALALAILIGVLSPKVIGLIPRDVADIEVKGRFLRAIDERGGVLWTHEFPFQLFEQAYAATPYGKSRRVWIGKGPNGRQQIVFAVSPTTPGQYPGQVLAFDHVGSTLWSFDAGRAVKDVGGSLMQPPYAVMFIEVLRGKTPSEMRVAVGSAHHEEQPAQIAFLDFGGNIKGEYWHPGHLYHPAHADLDRDGREKLIVGGVNNGNHQATLVVLDPLATGVTTPRKMKDGRFRLLGMDAAHEKAVVLFPRSCLSTGESYTRVRQVIAWNGHIFAHIAEGTDETSPGYQYDLDFNLQVIKVGGSGQDVPFRHQALERSGLLRHKYDDQKESADLAAHLIIQR